jgi:hypothetical protein
VQGVHLGVTTGSSVLLLIAAQMIVRAIGVLAADHEMDARFTGSTPGHPHAKPICAQVTYPARSESEWRQGGGAGG